MENDKTYEDLWEAEARLSRKVGLLSLTAAGVLAVSGRTAGALKAASLAGGSFAIAKLQSRLSNRRSG